MNGLGEINAVDRVLPAEGLATEWQQNAGFGDQSGAERRQPRSPWGHRQLSSDDVRREMTGRRTDQVHLARIAVGELLAEQQQAMIAKMLEAGVDIRRPSDNVLVDLITGETKPLQGSRMCRFLPNVAKRERGEYLNSLEAFMSSDEMKFARYGVIAAGQPFVAMDSSLRPALQGFHRKLSRWAAIAGARFGIDVIVRCTESTREKLSDRGLVGDEFSYHFHANVVYRPRSYNPKNGRGRYLLLTERAQITIEALPGRPEGGAIFKVTGNLLKKAFEYARARAAARAKLIDRPDLMTVATLRCRDFRHEAISRCFDAGWTSEQVMDSPATSISKACCGTVIPTLIIALLGFELYRPVVPRLRSQRKTR